MNALDLHRRGLAVIPVPPPVPGATKGRPGDGKVPSISWRRYQERRPEEASIRAWFSPAQSPRPNVGIITGAVSGVVVVDADSPEAEAWVASNLPETPMRATTAKGRHYYFRHPGVPVRNSARIIAADTNGRKLELDVRGDGGFVIGPGSLHASGVTYTAEGDWAVARDRLPVFDPKWLTRTDLVTPTAVSQTRALPTTDILARARAYAQATPGAVEGQGGDAHTFRLACRLVRGFDLSDGDALNILGEWNARCTPPWTPEELSAKVRNAREHGDEPFGALVSDRPVARPRLVSTSLSTTTSAVPDVDAWEAGEDVADPERAGVQETHNRSAGASYIEFAPSFLTREDPPVRYLVGELIPEEVLVLFHGEPRTRKSWAALEIAVAAATGTPAFGLPRFTPDAPIRCLYSSQEDGARMVRKRARQYLRARGIETMPDTLAFSVHKGINLEAPEWQARLVEDVKRHGFKIVVFDPIRRFSPNADKGPAEVRAITEFLRYLTTETGCTTLIVHHDVKPPAITSAGGDQRRRGHRASGGDWFAACEAPVAFESLGRHRTLVIPEDFKHSEDPKPFTLKIEGDPAREAIHLLGEESDTSDTQTVAIHERILEFLRHNPSSTSNTVWKGVRGNKTAVLDGLRELEQAGKVDSVEDKRATRWFVRGER